MSQRQDFPTFDVTELRRFLPALEMAERAEEEKRGELADNFEPTGLEVWVDAREEIRELRKMIRVPE